MANLWKGRGWLGRWTEMEGREQETGVDITSLEVFFFPVWHLPTFLETALVLQEKEKDEDDDAAAASANANMPTDPLTWSSHFVLARSLFVDLCCIIVGWHAEAQLCQDLSWPWFRCVAELQSFFRRSQQKLRPGMGAPGMLRPWQVWWSEWAAQTLAVLKLDFTKASSSTSHAFLSPKWLQVAAELWNPSFLFRSLWWNEQIALDIVTSIVQSILGRMQWRHLATEWWKCMLGVEWMDTGHRTVESLWAYIFSERCQRKDEMFRYAGLQRGLRNKQLFFWSLLSVVRLVEKWFSFATAKQRSAKESRCKNTTPDA